MSLNPAVLRGADGGVGISRLLTTVTAVPFGVAEPKAESPFLSRSSGSILTPSFLIVAHAGVATTTLPVFSINTLGGGLL